MIVLPRRFSSPSGTAWLLGALLAFPAAVVANPREAPATHSWVGDGWCRAIALSEGTLYVGGEFQAFAPWTGGGAIVDLDRGDVGHAATGEAGGVTAVVPDGGNGWFIGGTIRPVGSLTRNLAHVDAEGHVSDWSVEVGGTINCLLLESGRLFVGGAFLHVAGVPYGGLVVVDPHTGSPLPGYPRVEGAVRAIAREGSALYLGGEFLVAGGEPRSHLAAVDATTGALLPWNPGVDQDISALATQAGTVFVSSGPMTIQGAQRAGLAALDARTGALLPWDPRLSPDEYGLGVWALAIRGSTLYFAGEFSRVGDFEVRDAAAVDVRSGLPLRTWDPRPDEYGIRTIAIHGRVVYLGGLFRHLGGVARYRAGAVDAIDGHVLPWDPTATGPVLAIAVHGSNAYVGGGFEGIGGRVRGGLAAIDVATGAITDWNPGNINAFDRVRALAADPLHVYAVGVRSRGAQSPVFVFDTPAGAELPWNLTSDGRLDVISVQDGALYLGGVFDHMNGEPRSGLASVDVAAEALLPWNPAPLLNGRYPGISAISPHGSRVYVSGFFDELGGAARPNLGAVDAVAGKSTDWTPASGHGAALLAVMDTRIFAGEDGRVSALDAASGASLWETVVDGYVDAIAAGDGVVFVGGVFHVIDGQSHPGLAALDPVTGHVLPWNPFDSGWRGANGLAVAGDQLFGMDPGGVFSVSVPSAGPARHVTARAASARPTSLSSCSPLVKGAARLSLTVPGPGPVSVGVFDVQGRRIANLLDHAWLEAGTHEQSIHTTGWPRGLYFVRVDVAGRTETHRLAVIR